MTLSMAIALTAVTVALLALLGLIAVYGKLRQLEASIVVDISGYSESANRLAPVAVHPCGATELSIVAMLDQDCGLCKEVWNALCDFSLLPDAKTLRFIGLPAAMDTLQLPGSDRIELNTDPAVRADLFEGYTPVLLVIDRDGRIQDRKFIYSDTDVRLFLTEAVSNARSRDLLGALTP